MGLFSRRPLPPGRQGATEVDAALPPLTTRGADVFRRLAQQDLELRGLRVHVSDRQLVDGEGRTHELEVVARQCATLDPTTWKAHIAAHFDAAGLPASGGHGS